MHPDAQWYLASDGQTFGPYSREQLSKFVQGGQATGDTRVCLVGSSEWIPLA